MASHPQERFSRSLERATSLLTSIVALLLLVLVVVALAGVLIAAIEPITTRDFTHAAIEGLDGAFLVIILLELVHTTLSRGPLAQQLEEFLVIGVASAVRAGLEAVAQRGAEARSTGFSLALDAVTVLVLVVAICLVRQRLHVEQKP
jgi:hypothetical protein